MPELQEQGDSPDGSHPCMTCRHPSLTYELPWLLYIRWLHDMGGILSKVCTQCMLKHGQPVSHVHRGQWHNVMAQSTGASLRHGLVLYNANPDRVLLGASGHWLGGWVERPPSCTSNAPFTTLVPQIAGYVAYLCRDRSPPTSTSQAMNFSASSMVSVCTS